MTRVTAVGLFLRFWFFRVSMRVKTPGFHLAFLITSAICVFMTSFSSIWLSIPAGSNKYRRKKSRAYILLSFLTQSCGFKFFHTGGLDLGSGLVLDKNRTQRCRALQASSSPLHLPTLRSVFRGGGIVPCLPPLDSAF